MASESRPLVQEALREFRTKGSGARVIGIRESRLSFWTLSMVLHCALLDFGAWSSFLSTGFANLCRVKSTVNDYVQNGNPPNKRNDEKKLKRHKFWKTT